MRVLPIFGTAGGDWDENGQPCQDASHWWHFQEADGHDSAWWAYMRSLNFRPYRTDKGFSWTGELDGLFTATWWPWNWGRKTHPLKQWEAGGDALIYYATPIYEPFVVVAHSHGGAVALMAAANGLEIDVLITLGTPYRSDMRKVIDRALPNIRRWVHICDRNFDFIGQAGEFGDGVISISRTQPDALNLTLDGIDHSHLLQRPEAFHYWTERILPAAGIAIA